MLWKSRALKQTILCGVCYFWINSFHALSILLIKDTKSKHAIRYKEIHTTFTQCMATTFYSVQLSVSMFCSFTTRACLFIHSVIIRQYTKNSEPAQTFEEKQIHATFTQCMATNVYHKFQWRVSVFRSFTSRTHLFIHSVTNTAILKIKIKLRSISVTTSKKNISVTSEYAAYLTTKFNFKIKS